MEVVRRRLAGLRRPHIDDLIVAHFDPPGAEKRRVEKGRESVGERVVVDVLCDPLLPPIAQLVALSIQWIGLAAGRAENQDRDEHGFQRHTTLRSSCFIVALPAIRMQSRLSVRAEPPVTPRARERTERQRYTIIPNALHPLCWLRRSVWRAGRVPGRWQTALRGVPHAGHRAPARGARRAPARPLRGADRRGESAATLTDHRFPAGRCRVVERQDVVGASATAALVRVDLLEADPRSRPLVPDRWTQP